jgi:Plant specific mitochondrial import receptor subunit TOM20
MQAVRKFKQGIDIDGSRHDTKWCLGNAYTSQVGGVSLLEPCTRLCYLRQYQHASLLCCGRFATDQQYANDAGFSYGRQQQGAAIL